MDTKLKPWKYGLIGIAGFLLGVGFLVIWWGTDPSFIPLVLLGYVGGSIGGKIFRKPIGAIIGAFFGGLIFTAIGPAVAYLLLMIVWLNSIHANIEWIIPSVSIACLVVGGYQIIKDFRNGK